MRSSHLKLFPILSLLASCGGGGGGGDGGGGPPPPPPPPAAEFSLSTTALTFTATNRLEGPQPQTVIATVNTTAAGTLYVLAEVSGTAVSGISNFQITSPTRGQADVYVPDPNLLGTGTHTATITVRACMNSPTCVSGALTGSPRTVTVTYAVQPVAPPPDGVWPRIAVAGRTGDVIIRGTSLSGATSVQFGGQAATAVAVVSSTELHVTYPPLTAGTRAVVINNGAIPFAGNLVVTAPPSYVATALPYPAPDTPPGWKSRIAYDAERQAIYLVLRSNPASGTRLVKYVYGAGGWSAPEAATIPGLRNVIVGPTGAYLLGHTDTEILEIDPVSLAIRGTFPLPPGSQVLFPTGFYWINTLALTNDGYAVATFGCTCGSGFAPIFFYSPTAHTFIQVHTDGGSTEESLDVSGAHNPMAASSRDGGTVLIGSRFVYLPSSGAFLRRNFPHGLRQNNVPPLLEMDDKGTRFALSGTIDPSQYSSLFYTDIHDSNYQLLGRISEPPGNPALANLLSAMSPDGTRVHVLHRDFLQSGEVAMTTYDVSGGAPATSFPQIGARLSLPLMDMTWSDSGITITPDGSTIFVPADNGLFVQPVP